MNDVTVIGGAKLSPQGIDDLLRGFRSWQELGVEKAFRGGIPIGEGLQEEGKTFDPICQLSLMCAQTVLETVGPEIRKEVDGIVLGSVTGCLLTDINYFKTTEREKGRYASPSLFRYTLPNIAVAEICIAFQIKGTNIFVSAGEVSGLTAIVQAAELVQGGRVNLCLAGGVDIDSPEIRDILAPDAIDENFRSSAYLLLLQGARKPGIKEYGRLTHFQTSFGQRYLGEKSALLGNQGAEDLWRALKGQEPCEMHISCSSYDGHRADITMARSGC